MGIALYSCKLLVKIWELLYSWTSRKSDFLPDLSMKLWEINWSLPFLLPSCEFSFSAPFLPSSSFCLSSCFLTYSVFLWIWHGLTTIKSKLCCHSAQMFHIGQMHSLHSVHVCKGKNLIGSQLELQPGPKLDVIFGASILPEG